MKFSISDWGTAITVEVGRMLRNDDGTLRGAHQPKRVSEKIIRARWVEAEALQAKKVGMSDLEIAKHITRVGRAEGTPFEPLPPGITFPHDYEISHQAVSKAQRRALSRVPIMRAMEFRKLALIRLEALIFSLQLSLQKGIIGAAKIILATILAELRLFGEVASKDHPANSPRAATGLQIEDSQAEAMYSRLTPADRAELIRIHHKLDGSAVADAQGDDGTDGQKSK